MNPFPPFMHSASELCSISVTCFLCQDWYQQPVRYQVINYCIFHMVRVLNSTVSTTHCHGFTFISWLMWPDDWCSLKCLVYLNNCVNNFSLVCTNLTEISRSHYNFAGALHFIGESVCHRELYTLAICKSLQTSQSVMSIWGL